MRVAKSDSRNAVIRRFFSGSEGPRKIAVLPSVSPVIYPGQNYVGNHFSEVEPDFYTVARCTVDGVELVCTVMSNLLARDVAPFNRDGHSNCGLPALRGEHYDVRVPEQSPCSTYQYVDSCRVVTVVIHNAYR